MVTSDLPQEILIDIFSRLPAKSVGRCRCLAKIWRNLLSTPQFIKSHLSRKPHQQNILLTNRNGYVHSIDDVAVSRRLESMNGMEFAGSHDGLVLFVEYENVMILVNPITQQQMKITDSPLALIKDESSSMFGFGYDKISDDYKIVVLSYWNGDSEHNPDTFVDVYSVKGGFWKRAHNSPYVHRVSDFRCALAFLNGAIHWLACTRGRGEKSVIAVFNLAARVFDEIPAPSGIDFGYFEYFKLVVVNGWLCLVDGDYGRETDVWIMKEYGVGESWTKLTIDEDTKFETIKPLCFVGDEELVFLSEERTLNVYNVKEKTSREMVVNGVSSMKFIDGGTFIETLVSPCFTSSSIAGPSSLLMPPWFSAWEMNFRAYVDGKFAQLDAAIEEMRQEIAEQGSSTTHTYRRRTRQRRDDVDSPQHD